MGVEKELMVLEMGETLVMRELEGMAMEKTVVEKEMVEKEMVEMELVGVTMVEKEVDLYKLS